MKATRLPAKLIRNIRCSCSARLFTPTILSKPRQPSPTLTRALSTSSEPPPRFAAAPEIKFPAKREEHEEIEDEEVPAHVNARLIPVSPSYFTRTPQFYDKLLLLRSLLRKFATLPVIEQGKAPREVWQRPVDFQNNMGESVRPAKYAKIIAVLDRLNQIHPSVMPSEVKTAVKQFFREIDPNANIANPISVDKFGRALGTGRRKSSTARAWVVEGNGQVLINGKSLAEAFGRIHDRESAIWALKSTDRIDKYNVWALVQGGGTTGQAEAITLAVAKALIAHEPLLKPALRRAGCVTRDPRTVERKKTGHLKARKMPAWVKR